MRRGHNCLISVAVISVLWARGVHAQGVNQDVPDSARDDAADVSHDSPSTTELGAAALPGGTLVAYPTSLPVGAIAVAGTLGGGFRNRLLGPSHKWLRGSATLGLGFSPLSWLSVGVGVSGMADKHSGSDTVDSTMLDYAGSGKVGTPSLFARVGWNGPKLGYGAQVRVWFPGREAPSFVASAISAEARGLVSTQVGPVLLSGNAGFRLDNSANTVDGRGQFAELSDHISIGVAESNSVAIGVRAAMPWGRISVGIESEAQLYLAGDDRAEFALLTQADVHVRIARRLHAIAFAGGSMMPSLANSDVVARTIPFFPWQPTLSGGLGLSAQFGGSKKAPAPVTGGGEDPPAVVKTGTLIGRVVDDAGVPVSGATIVLAAADGTSHTVATDNSGQWSSPELPLGNVNIDVSATGKLPTKSTGTVRQGAAQAVPDTVLAPELPPGTLYFKISDFSGKGVRATVTIEPGGTSITTEADGTAELPIAPGTYRVTITAPGFKPQTSTYVVDENGSTIVGAELRK